jgi:hypothetical protein
MISDIPLTELYYKYDEQHSAQKSDLAKVLLMWQKIVQGNFGSNHFFLELLLLMYEVIRMKTVYGNVSDIELYHNQPI